MSAIDSLIRLHRHRLDEKRRHLAELDRLAERLQSEGHRLEQELLSEQEIAAASPEARHAYSNYARELNERRAKLAASLEEVEGQTAAAREALAEAFQEVKRYEITAANRQKRERQILGRRIQVEQDEIAAQLYSRRESR